MRSFELKIGSQVVHMSHSLPMPKLVAAMLLIGVAGVIQSCGNVSDGSGFLSDHNVCKPNNESALVKLKAASPVVTMLGIPSSNLEIPLYAQMLKRNSEKIEAAGVYLWSQPKESAFKASLWTSLPGGPGKELTVASSRFAKEQDAYTYFSFSEIVTLEKDTDHWLVISPLTQEIPIENSSQTDNEDNMPDGDNPEEGSERPPENDGGPEYNLSLNDTRIGVRKGSGLTMNNSQIPSWASLLTFELAAELVECSK
jgi:hypothetical protein